MYRALLNGEEFFSTENKIIIPNERENTLTSARLRLTAGAAGEFTFIMPPSNIAYGNIHKLIDFIDVYRDDDIIFSGRVFSIEESFDTQLKVVCEGLLALLNDSIFRPITFEGELHTLVRQIITNHNSQVEASKQIQIGRLLIDNSTCYRAYERYETSISRLQDLVKSYGGWMRIRKENGIKYFDWYKTNIDGTDQRIDFGENLLNVKQIEDSDGIITVLIPLGTADDNNVRIDIKSVNNNLDYIEAGAEYIQKYGYIVGSQIWDDINVPSVLKTRGQQWLNAAVTPKKTIEVTAVDLADAGYDVNAFHVGQKIRVTSKPHDIDMEWFDCVSQDLDLLYPSENKLVLGSEKIGYIKAARSQSAEVKSSLERIAATYTTKSALETSIERATNLISGNSGGYVVLHDSNDDGEPDELLIMDTDNIETAVKVWRFNNAGLGYSSTGYNGTYGLAMTMDGQIVANYITSGILNAALIKTGRLQKADGTGSYFDLDTGDLYISGTSTVDKSKIFITQPTTPYYAGDAWMTDYTTSGGTGSIKVCINAKTSGAFDANDWELVTDYISASTINNLQSQISNVQLTVDQQATAIQSKADAIDVTNLETTVNEAIETIDGHDARIESIATQAQTAITRVDDKATVFRSEPTVPYHENDLWIIGTEVYTAIVAETITDTGYAIAGDNNDSILTKNSAVVNWSDEIWIALTDKSTGSFDWADWAPAINYDSDLTIIKQELRSAQIAIDGANAKIELKASEDIVTDLQERIETAEIKIDGAEAIIALKADSTTVDTLTESIPNVNLLPSVYYDENLNGKVYENNGITWTVNSDGSITATGTATANSSYRLTGSAITADQTVYDIPAITVDPEKKYTFHCLDANTSNGSATTYNFNLSYVSAVTRGMIMLYSSTVRGPGYTKIGASIRIVNGYECPEGGITFYPMLEAGSEPHEYVSTHNGTGALITRIKSAEVNIDGANAQIEARTQDITTLQDDMTTVKEAVLTILPDQISSKVSSTDYNGATIASLINQSASNIIISATHIDIDGQLTISAFNSTTKSSLLSNTTVKSQYYLSTSSSSTAGGSWSDDVPTWSSGKYIWIRTATTKTDASGTATTTYSTAKYDKALTEAASTAATANTTANTASSNVSTALKRQGARWGTCSTAANTAAKAVSLTDFELYAGAQITVYFANANTAASPTLNVNSTGAKSIYIKNAAITAPYYWQANDTVSFTYNGSYWVMAESSALATIANWCYNNDKTYIDGGLLATGTVTATKISVSDLYAIGATIGAFTIDSNSIYSGTKDTGTENADITLRGSGTFTRSIGGTSRSSLKFAIGSRFGVSTGGICYMSNAVITGGNIVVTSLGNTTNYITLTGSDTNYSCWLSHRWIGFNYGSQQTFWGTDTSTSTFGRQYLAFITGTSYKTYLGASTSGASLSMQWGTHTAYIGYQNSKSTLLIETVTQSSDKRKKRDIVSLDKQKTYDFVMSLNPVSYKLLDSPVISHGLIAQEVKANITNDAWKIVSEDENGYLSIAYTELIADLIAIVQQQDERIKALEARI